MEPRKREIVSVIEPQPVVEGAGVKLKRSIATQTLNYVDPFLLFDHFGSDNPDDYLAGFPMHPHRGIETVTYMLAGEVDHKDTLGNAGTIGAGDVQWMTSGGGIMHEEMPRPVQGKMEGFQLWVNLPARLKMSEPRYQEIQSDTIPVLEWPDGSLIRVVAGNLDGVQGPATEIAANPNYIDVSLPPDTTFCHPVLEGHAAFAYLFEGAGAFGHSPAADAIEIRAPKLIVLGDGDTVTVTASDTGVRFLLISGKPLHEPIARHGPFVMNTSEEIEQALQDLRRGTFVWKKN
jgi:redox-sensitive bicupin YhaK (pirin superfamily)